MLFGGEGGVPLTFVAAGSVGTGTNPTAGVPAGVIAGDLLVLVTAAGSAGLADPAGWTIGSNSSGNLRAYYKTAGASEGNLTITSSPSASTAVMVAYRGSASLNVNGTLSGPAGTGTSVPTNSLTTTVANTLVVSAFSCANGSGAFTSTPITGTNERVSSAATASIRGIYLCDEMQVASGATTVRTINWTTATGNKAAGSLSFKTP